MPFVLLHGALLWKLAIVAVVAVVFGVIAVVRHFDARYWIRATVRSFDISTHERVIRGVLGGGGATSHGDTHTRTPEMWIDTDEGRFALVGAIRVLAGSRARGKFIAVAPGDQVIAHGTITRAPGRAAHYRADSTDFALTADGAAPVLLAARVPAIGVTSLSLAAKLWTAGATIVLSLIVLCAAGAHWHDRCVRAKPEGLTNTNACVLASATPGRDDAGPLYETTWWGSAERLTVARYLGDCDHLLTALAETGAWDELAATADRCGAPDVQQRALAELGRFADATALGHRHSGVPLGVLYILTQQWDDAALQAERLARESHDPPQANHWRCLGLLLRGYGGTEISPHAFGRSGDCSGMRDELTQASPLQIETSISFPWHPRYEAGLPLDHQDDPVALAQLAMTYARYAAATRDHRVRVALSLWD